MNIFDMIEEAEDDECLFCDGECTCGLSEPPLNSSPVNNDAWQLKLHTGSPVYVDKLRDKTKVWCVVISVDRFNETIVCFDKNSGRHQDIAWSRLIPTPGYAD